MKKKTILGITTFVILGVIIALFLYITFPSLKNKRNTNNVRTVKKEIGDKPICIFNGTTKFYEIESDSTGNKPDITSNTVNVDTSKLLSFIQYNGCYINIFTNTNNYRYLYYITKIDATKNTITFNAPENFQLSSAEAWPFYIVSCKQLPLPEIIQ